MSVPDEVAKVENNLLAEWEKEAEEGEGEEPFVPSDDALSLMVQYLDFLYESDEDIGKDNITTWRQRKSNLKAWVRWCEEERGVDIREAERSDLVRHIDSIYNRLSHPSIGARVGTIGVFYLWGANRDIFENNPSEGFTLEDSYDRKIDPNTPKQILVLRSRDELDDDQNVVAISPDVVSKMIDHPGSPALRNRLVIKLLYHTGCRVSEMVDVRVGTDPDWSNNDLGDLDIENNRIRVTTAKTEAGDSNHKRWVYFGDELEYDLYKWIAHERSNRQTAPDSDRLLLTTHKPQMRASHLSRIVKRSAKRAEVNEPLYEDAAGKTRWLITGHTLRHSMASFFANKTDMPLHILANILGHRKLDTTRRYISDDPEAEAKHAHRSLNELKKVQRAG